MERLGAGGLVCVVLALACGPGAVPAAPAPASTASGGSVGAAAAGVNGAPAAGSGGAAVAAAPSDAAYRQQVIDGARAEGGEVNILLSSIWTPETLKLLEEAVERDYGVRLRINRTPSTNYGAHAAQLMSELQAGATPSYDLHQSSDASSSLLIQADALEPVNWAALLPPGTPPEVVQGDGRVLVTYTSFNGIMYDPTVVPESEAPRSLRDLANPRWRDKVMLASSPDLHMPYVYKWGREPALEALRAVVQNGATTGTFFDQQNRYAAKEVAMIEVSSIIYASARLRGMPGEFTLLDFADTTSHQLSVPRRAAHPNSAKLLAAVITGPEGQAIAAEYIGSSNRYYSGSWEQQRQEQANAAGLPTFSWWGEPGALDFLLSPAGEDVRKEINTVLQGG
ncbi:MAG TPA: extracellular solute-binding protein [Chloroflexota bacterium]|jgi:ABC-type Fe3+ transport system substrate-binding protein